jgi:hypothetical protein
MRGRAAKALSRSSYKNNQLLPLGPGFRAPLETVADAVALYFYGDGVRGGSTIRDQALAHLRRTAERLDDGTA